MKSLKDIQKIVSRFDVKPRPQMRSKVLGQALEIQKVREQQSNFGTNIWRLIMKSKITKFAAAAIIIIAILISISQFGRPINVTSMAFAEVSDEIKKAVNQMPLMHKILYTDIDGKEHYTEKWYWFESKSMLSKHAIDGECFKISSLNYATMENIVYDPDSNVATISYRVDVSPIFLPDSPWSIVGEYIEDYVRQEANIRHKKGTYEANDVDIYYFSIPRNSKNEREETEFIVNRNSHLPISYKRKFWTSEGHLRFDQVIDFEFPENGPKDIYGLGVPSSTKVVYDLESKKRFEKKRLLQQEKALCEEQFQEVYRLKEAEVLKNISPLLAESRIRIDEIDRAIYILEREGSLIMPPLSPDEIKRMNEKNHYTMFSWNGERAKKERIFQDGVSIKKAFERIIVLSQFQYDGIPETLSSIKIPGDWIVRKGAPKEELIYALEEIIRDFTNRPISFEKRSVERNVIVARGEFSFEPLSGTYDDSYIHVFSDKLDPDERGGGGTYSLDRFLTQRLAETQIKQQVINLTESSDSVMIKCGCHMSAYLGKIPDGAERSSKLDLLLENLSRQTSLVFTKERHEVDIWHVVEDVQN